MTRCMFCDDDSFKNLDDAMMHQMMLNSKGEPVCLNLRHMGEVMPSYYELFPMKILGRKYAPKNHDGTFMMYDNKGKISKTKLVRYLLS